MQRIYCCWLSKVDTIEMSDLIFEITPFSYQDWIVQASIKLTGFQLLLELLTESFKLKYQKINNRLIRQSV